MEMTCHCMYCPTRVYIGYRRVAIASCRSANLPEYSQYGRALYVRECVLRGTFKIRADDLDTTAVSIPDRTMNRSIDQPTACKHTKIQYGGISLINQTSSPAAHSHAPFAQACYTLEDHTMEERIIHRKTL